jgi:MraZ protein
MFAGEYLCKLDEKGRFIIPSPMRERVQSEGNGVVFLKGEHSLQVYSTAEWERLLAKTKDKLDDDQKRLFMHFVVSEVGTSEVDKAGRVLIPGRFRKLVPIEDDLEITLVGLYNHMEVWNPANWRRYLSKTEDSNEQNLNKIYDLLSSD